jgi:hypothetical protein
MLGLGVFCTRAVTLSRLSQTSEARENLPAELGLSADPNRVYKRAGQLKKLCRRGMRTFRFYLFSDMLLYCRCVLCCASCDVVPLLSWDGGRRDEMGLSNVFGLRRSQSSAASNKSTTSYRALNLRQTLLEPAPFKYPHAFMLRSPAKSFVVQAPDEPTCRLWEAGWCSCFVKFERTPESKCGLFCFVLKISRIALQSLPCGCNLVHSDRAPVRVVLHRFGIRTRKLT